MGPDPKATPGRTARFRLVPILETIQSHQSDSLGLENAESMNCVGCGFVVQAEFAFCPKCGARQPARCVGCGYACPPDFAFCPKCGQKQGATPYPIEAPPAAAPPPSHSASPEPFRPVPVARLSTIPALTGEADRRSVTVLFADLSGFTTLSEQLDPEVMQALQNELFEELTAAVQEFGGFVDKFVGDALLALFGAPHAHENDPRAGTQGGACHARTDGAPRCPLARARRPTAHASPRHPHLRVRKKPGSVTHVSGTMCHPCLRPLKPIY
jgi:RNA polymerase subunit RPABC4/transcription elongation factor Spt4